MTSLTTFHFFVTFFLLEILCRIGTIKRADQFPHYRRWIQAFWGDSAVILMNFNLQKNSLGFYQLSKLCCIPATILVNYINHRKRTPLNTIISLAILLFGVGIFSINDVEVNLTGSLVALVSIFATAIFQARAADEQKEFEMSGPSIQHATALQQAIMGLIASIFLEVFGPNSILKHTFVKKEVILIILSGLFAVAVNAVCFAIIGKTSAVTYQVVGHVKTIIVIVCGYVFFPPTQVDQKKLIKTIVGVIISLVGISMYTYIELTSNKQPKIAALSNLDPSENTKTPLAEQNMHPAGENSK